MMSCDEARQCVMMCRTANLRTNIMDFTGFDSSIILILSGGILMSTGDFQENSSQAIFPDCLSLLQSLTHVSKISKRWSAGLWRVYVSDLGLWCDVMMVISRRSSYLLTTFMLYIYIYIHTYYTIYYVHIYIYIVSWSAAVRRRRWMLRDYQVCCIMLRLLLLL